MQEKRYVSAISDISTLCFLALLMTSMSGILSFHLIFRSFRRQRTWKRLSLLAWRWYTVQVSHPYKGIGSKIAVSTFSFVSNNLIEKSRECHHQKPQPNPGTKRKRKRTNNNACKINKQIIETHMHQLPLPRVR